MFHAYTTKIEHLHHEFRRLDCFLEQSIKQFQVQRNQSQPAEFQGLYIRIAEFLLGSDRLDARLCTPRPLAQQTLNDLLLPDSVNAALQHLITLDTTHSSWFCLLHGSAGVGKQTCAEAIAKAKNRPLLVVDLPAILKAELPFQNLLNLAFRQAQCDRFARRLG
jgi:hypothetical protein